MTRRQGRDILPKKSIISETIQHAQRPSARSTELTDRAGVRTNEQRSGGHLTGRTAWPPAGSDLVDICLVVWSDQRESNILA